MGTSDRSPVLEFVAVSYHDPRFPGPLLESIDFSLAPGEALALAGPAGSGKSTAVGLALGASRAGGGEVLVLGRSPSELDRTELCRPARAHRLCRPARRPARQPLAARQPRAAAEMAPRLQR